MERIDNLIPAQRQKQIIDLINLKGIIQINEVAKLFNVSYATARRDIDSLVIQGKVSRTHGGAVLNNQTASELTQTEKHTLMVREKESIAEAAAKLVKNGNSVFFDSGTTTFFVAQKLTDKKNLTVITNNTEIIHNVQFDPTSTIIVTGGIKRQNFSVLVGSFAENFINSINVDLVFLGADAVSSKKGVYNSSIDEIGVKKSLFKCSKKIVLVTDSSKFSKSGLINICNISDLYLIITDNKLTARDRLELLKQKTKLILVN